MASPRLVWKAETGYGDAPEVRNGEGPQMHQSFDYASDEVFANSVP